jgi:type IV secretion system protein TrbB
MLKDHSRTQAKLKEDLGEKILAALADAEIYEIMLNDDGILWVDGFLGMREYGQMTADAAQSFINTVSSVAEKITNKNSPSFSAELWLEIGKKLNLYRFQGFIPPVVEKPSFIIRKHAGQVIPLVEFVKDGIITEEQEKMLVEAVRARESILVAGGTQSGKTTFTNAILDSLAKETPNDRVVTVEDTRELQCNVRNWLRLQSSPVKSLNDLISDAMRSRPDRIIIGEVRGMEAHSLIKSWNTGHRGGICTIHANSCKSALLRLEQLISEAKVDPVPGAIVEAVNILVYIEKTKKGKKGRQVTSILKLKGYDRQQGYLYD